MLVLAIDTASADCAACLFDTGSGRVLASRAETIGTGHAERLMGQIGEVLAEAEKAYDDLERVAVSVGPGSFTGVRVAVAAARGLALALKVPAIGISTLEALAADARDTKPGVPALAMIDAKRGQIYAQAFGADGAAVNEPAVVPLEETEALALPGSIIAGSGGSLLAGSVSPDCLLFGDRSTGAIATFARLAAIRDPVASPVPLYLRAPDAKPQAGFALPRAAGA